MRVFLVFVQVQATDQGRPQRHNQIRVIFTVVERPATSEHAPSFVSTETVARVMENDPVGTMVMIMEAKDEDGDKLWFSITGKLLEAIGFTLSHSNVICQFIF